MGTTIKQVQGMQVCNLYFADHSTCFISICQGVSASRYSFSSIVHFAAFSPLEIILATVPGERHLWGILGVHNFKPHINRYTCTTVLHAYWLDAKFRFQRLYWYSFWPMKRFCVNEDLSTRPALWAHHRPRECACLPEQVIGEVHYDYIAFTSLHFRSPYITRYMFHCCYSQKNISK